MASRNPLTQTARQASEADLEMLTSGKFADAKVESNGRTWAVHRAIVCGRSNWFDKALGGEFKEAAEMKVTLHDMPSAQVDWLLRYIYGGDDLLKDTGYLDKNPFLAICVAHYLGDYFDMTDLTTAAIVALRDQYATAIDFYEAEPARQQPQRSWPRRVHIPI